METTNTNARVYANQSLVDFLTEMKAVHLWQAVTKNGKNEIIVTAFQIGDKIVLVQQYVSQKTHAGWDIFVPADDTHLVAPTLEAVRSYVAGATVQKCSKLYDLLVNALSCEWSDNGNLNAGATRDLIMLTLDNLGFKKEDVDRDVEETVELNQ